jgi:hypothetical protein
MKKIETDCSFWKIVHNNFAPLEPTDQAALTDHLLQNEKQVGSAARLLSLVGATDMIDPEVFAKAQEDLATVATDYSLSPEKMLSLMLRHDADLAEQYDQAVIDKAHEANE